MIILADCLAGLLLSFVLALVAAALIRRWVR